MLNKAIPSFINDIK